MSKLAELKGYIFAIIPEDTKTELRSSLLDCMNAIDSDLDEQGYQHSSDVDEAFEELERVITGEAAEDDIINEDEDEIELTPNDEDEFDSDSDEEEEETPLFSHEDVTEEDDDAST